MKQWRVYGVYWYKQYKQYKQYKPFPTGSISINSINGINSLYRYWRKTLDPVGIPGAATNEAVYPSDPGGVGPREQGVNH